MGLVFHTTINRKWNYNSGEELFPVYYTIEWDFFPSITHTHRCVGSGTSMRAVITIANGFILNEVKLSLSNHNDR